MVITNTKAIIFEDTFFSECEHSKIKFDHKFDAEKHERLCLKKLTTCKEWKNKNTFEHGTHFGIDATSCNEKYKIYERKKIIKNHIANMELKCPNGHSMSLSFDIDVYESEQEVIIYCQIPVDGGICEYNLIELMYDSDFDIGKKIKK